MVAKRPEFIADLEYLGHERQLIYKMLLLTGLRKNELASITIGQLYLDGPHPYAELKAADEKNRQGSEIPLRSDLVADLVSWVGLKAERVRTQAIAFKGQKCQQVTGIHNLPADTPLFDIPDKLVAVFDRDIAAAGIPKRDDRDRTVDVHALRTTFVTLMAKGGVAPRVTQAAARHGDIALTMQRYTDPQLLDIAGALEVLPELPLGISHSARPEPMRATGTEDASGAGARTVAPNVAPDADRNRPSLSFLDHQAAQSNLDALDHEATVDEALSADPDTKKGSLTIAVNEPFRVESSEAQLNFFSPPSPSGTPMFPTSFWQRDPSISADFPPAVCGQSVVLALIF